MPTGPTPTQTPPGEPPEPVVAAGAGLGGAEEAGAGAAGVEDETAGDVPVAASEGTGRGPALPADVVVPPLPPLPLARPLPVLPVPPLPVPLPLPLLPPAPLPLPVTGR